MKTDGKKEKKNRTAGFSLVEVIVAVALLGVVTVPIISSMIQTARINEKARSLQKATDLAQNLMEGIREYTMAEVIEQCIGNKDFSIIYSSIISYEPNGYTYLNGGSSFLTQLQATTSDDPIYGVVDNSETYTSFGDDEYNFAFCGITYNKTEFDAIVTFTKYEEEEETDPNGVVTSQSAAEAGPYCIYEVEISIYSSYGNRFSDNARITSVTGAVQNE